MKFDNVIIGGGLSGLSCGIKLSEQGKKCAIVSSGQSAIHFFSGSFDLLSKFNDTEVENPLEAIKSLPAAHPYQRLGIDNLESMVSEAPQLLKRAGLNFTGETTKNHYVLTPMGLMKPTWLTLDDFSTFDQKDVLPWKKALIVNFEGFLDFHTLFVKDGLSKLSIQAEIKTIAMKQFEAIRRNPSEMRSTNIAKVFDQGDALIEFTQKINKFSKDTDVVILPAVFGLFNKNIKNGLKARIRKPLVLVPVVPPSVPGIRTQIQLRQYFQNLGGTYFLGDNVEEGAFEANRLLAIKTNNHGNIQLEAKQFVLASGSFYSKGLVATPHRIYDPIFNLDIDGSDDRSEWFDDKIFNCQPYMNYGIKTDENFRAIKNGKPIENLFVAGSALSGANSLKEGSGAGISLLTSLHVAEQILK